MKMVEEYDCLICGGIADLYDSRDNHAPISEDEDPAFFDYRWNPDDAYQAKPEDE